MIWRLLFLLLMFGGCLRAEIAPDSPSAVVQKFYLAIGKGDVVTEKSLYSAIAQTVYQYEQPQIRATMESGVTVTFGDTITGVGVLKENLRGDRAWVDVVIHYQHHADQKFNAEVIKEAGVWKLTNA